MPTPERRRRADTGTASRGTGHRVGHVRRRRQPDRGRTGLAAAVVAWGAPADAGTLDEATFREEIELALADLTAAGAGVVLGRAGAVVLSDDERALHVRLDGPVERRIAAAMSRARIDRETAARQLERTDRARTAYVQHLYGVDARDPRLYHLIIDSTTLSLETCVDLIATAARDREAPPGRT